MRPTHPAAEFTAYEMLLRAANVAPEAARREAERKFGRAAAGVDVPEVDERALEKAIERAGDKLMRAFGFVSVHFSQARETNQTPGIADRRYYRVPRSVERADGRFHQRALMPWWEAKSATGRQTPDERAFQELVEACGETYLLGTTDALVAWLVAERIAVMVNGILEAV